MEIKFNRCSENAIVPIRATVGSVGYDLQYAVGTCLVPFKLELVKSDVILEIPKEFYGKVVGRSRLALSGISTHVGTLDSDFRDIACVLLTKISQRVDYPIKKGDRISQIIFEKNLIKKLSECAKNEELDITESGCKGFGSTGK